MAEHVNRFVEWALEADCYVMVEVVDRGPDAHPRRSLSSPMHEFELRHRLRDAGVSAAEAEQLVTEARARARADRLDLRQAATGSPAAPS